MIHWVTQFYEPKDAKKSTELRACLVKNLKLPFISKITLFLDDTASCPICDDDKRIRLVHLMRRARYRDFLEIVDRERSSSEIMLLTNSDIIITDDIKDLSSRIHLDSTVLALTRRELDGNYPKLSNLGWSQDAWLMKAQPISPLLLDTANISLGVAGCENIFTAQLAAHAYNIWNPCLDARIIHNDPSPSFDYNTDQRYLGFYVHPMPCRSEAIERVDPEYDAKFRSKFFSIAITT